MQNRFECENDLENIKERIEKQENRLQKAREVVRVNARRAKKLIEGADDWRIFQVRKYYIYILYSIQYFP